jgi:prolipoprotein diacylglyceryltransferase
MLPILQIGPLAIQVPGLVLLLGLWLGLSLVERNASRSGSNAGLLYNLVLVALLSGVVGARLSYAIRYFEIFSSSPFSLISLNPGLLDPWGGVAVALIAALIYGQRKELSVWPTLDALTPLFAVITVSYGVSHLTSGAAFGAPTGVPWGIELWGIRRHPTQVYEILAATLILIAVWPGINKLQTSRPGLQFLVFAALSAAARLFLEGFRGDSQLLPGGIRSAQAIAWMVLAASLWGLGRLRGPNRGLNLSQK